MAKNLKTLKNNDRIERRLTKREKEMERDTARARKNILRSNGDLRLTSNR